MLVRVLLVYRCALIGLSERLRTDILLGSLIVSSIGELAGLIEELDLIWPGHAHLRHDLGSYLLIDSEEHHISILPDRCIIALKVTNCILNDPADVYLLLSEVMSFDQALQ